MSTPQPHSDQPCPPLDWRRLPAGLARLRDLLGEEAALLLARTNGGQPLYIPRHLPPEHSLVRLLGSEVAKQLARVHGGERLDVPKADSVLRQLRGRSIRDAHAQGVSITALAEAHKLSRRRILQILGE